MVGDSALGPWLRPRVGGGRGCVVRGLGREWRVVDRDGGEIVARRLEGGSDSALGPVVAATGGWGVGDA